jgi:hypothetical protein
MRTVWVTRPYPWSMTNTSDARGVLTVRSAGTGARTARTWCAITGTGIRRRTRFTTTALRIGARFRAPGTVSGRSLPTGRSISFGS